MSYQDPLEKTMIDFHLERVSKYISDDERSMKEIATALNKPLSVIHYWLNHKRNTQIVQSTLTGKWHKKYDLDFLFDNEDKLQVMRDALALDDIEFKDYMQHCLHMGKVWLGRFDFYAEHYKRRLEERE